MSFDDSVDEVATYLENFGNAELVSVQKSFLEQLVQAYRESIEITFSPGDEVHVRADSPVSHGCKYNPGGDRRVWKIESVELRKHSGNGKLFVQYVAFSITRRLHFSGEELELINA